MSLRESFIALDDALAAKGVPPLTAWWRDGIGRWLDLYERDHVLELWVCAGRGSSKSTALYKLNLLFALVGEFSIPAGEMHYAIVLSRLKEEAAKGVAIIARWCTLLGVRHRLVGDVIELLDRPRGIRVVAASVAATSGFRAFAVGKDERSKLPASCVDELDAEEIDTSAAAMTATHRFAPVFAFGSAWGSFGRFFDAIAGGTDATRVVLGPTPTWVAAPHITEEDCRRKERDPRRFAREYACEFQAISSAVLDPDRVRAAFRPRGQGEVAQEIAVIDKSSGMNDAEVMITAAVIHEEATGSPVLEEDRVVHDHRGIPSIVRVARHDDEGRQIRNPDYDETPRRRFIVTSMLAFVGRFDPSAVLATEGAYLRSRGIRKLIGDEHLAAVMGALYQPFGIAYESIKTTTEKKVESGAMLGRLLTAGDLIIDLPPDQKHLEARLLRELLSLREVLLGDGRITLQSPRTADSHGDAASALLLLAFVIARADGTMPQSPIRNGGGPPTYFDPYDDND